MLDDDSRCHGNHEELYTDICTVKLAIDRVSDSGSHRNLPTTADFAQHRRC